MKSYALVLALSALFAADQAAAFQDTSKSIPYVPPVGKGMPGATQPDSSVRQEYDSRRMRNDAATSGYTTSQAIAHCLVTKAKSGAGAYLGGEMTADVGYQNLQKALGGKYSGCVGSGATNIQMSVLDGAVAEELLRLEHPTLADRESDANLALAKTFSTGPSGLTVTSLGRCLAAYSPGLSYKMLATPMDSAAERAALTGLYHASPECGRTDTPTNIPLDQQRAAVASGLYHWVHRT